MLLYAYLCENVGLPVLVFAIELSKCWKFRACLPSHDFPLQGNVLFRVIR
jgi:hypothetical protein